MSKFSPYISIASILLLSSCGSGGSSDNEDTSPPATYNFTLTNVLTNDCGVESAYNDVELVLQDENWQTISSHQPNADGIIELTTQNAKINYTLIAKSRHKDAVEGIKAVSFFNVKSTSSAKFYATNVDQIENSSCECQANDVILTHTQLDELNAAYSSAEFINYERIDSISTRFVGVNTCRNKEEEWPEQTFSVEGPSGNYDLVGVSGFGTGHENLYASYPAFNYDDLNNKNPTLTFSQFFNGLRHFATEVPEYTGTVLVYDNHKYSDVTVYSGYGTKIFDETGSGPLTRTTLNSEHETININYPEALDVQPSTEKPNIDLEYLSEIEDNGEYDFSAVKNYEMAIITFDYLAKDPLTQLDMPATWTVYGPIEGLLPTVNGLPGYEDIISADTSIKGTFVKLVRSYDSSDYDDYINYYALGLESTDEKLTHSFAQERRFYNINIELK